MVDAEERLRALMIRSLAGDSSAYRALLTELGRHLGAYFSRRLGAGSAEPEDLVQDTLLAIHSRRATYDTARPFTAWVYAIARYKLADHFRRHGGARSVPVDDAADIFAPDDTNAAIAKSDVERMLATLPPSSAALVRRVRIEGDSVADTAAATGLSEASVKVGVHRGVKALAARFHGRKQP